MNVSLLSRPVPLVIWVLAVALGCLVCRPATAAEVPRIDILLWFDTEDYLLPADDDACLRLATLLSDRGIRATFKVVGEKARTLERRGRTDVITALQRHAIGYHANFHSVHPTPTEYLADCGWLDGVAEFIRREGGGASDVRRIFGVPTLACYGQPGSSWGPQGVAALGPIGVAPQGVPCYVDEGSNVGWDQKPFWYAGALNVYHMGKNHTRMELHDPAAVEPGMKEASAVAERLAREDGGGLISIYYHPCEWVHQEFWDGVNFRRGHNPPREAWKAPPQLPSAETEAAFQRFTAYVDRLQKIPGSHFITAADLPLIYSDRLRSEGLGTNELAQLSKQIADTVRGGLTVQRLGNKVLSPADQFEVFSTALAQFIVTGTVHAPIVPRGLFGPDGVPPAPQVAGSISWFTFRDTCRDVYDFVASQHRIPARVYIGSDQIAPADFLVMMAEEYLHCAELGKVPEDSEVRLRMGTANSLERYLAADTPELFGGWIIHREGFRAPRVVEMARLQAWTLKPAIRVGL